METKRATPKKEKTVKLLLTDKFLKDMSSEVINFHKKQLNLAAESNGIAAYPVSSIPSMEKVSFTVFYKLFFSEKMEKQIFTTLSKTDRQQKATEKLLKEMTGIYCKQLDISIETNKCILKIQYQN